MNFRVSSGLKDLIGSELITDDNIAVFELVKNSFDAGAKKVTLKFEDIYGDNPRIIIIDDGKGMDYTDLRDKWLFVAYSAKRDFTEDEDENEDYRKRIKLRKFYAGAKGVGRFSCDRLGESLNLITIKKKSNAKIECLTVNWRDFEVDQKKEFIDIAVKHKVLKTSLYKIKHGTVLEISKLRNKEDWHRESFKVLKEKLSKLIRPQIGNTIKDNNFKIILEVDDEKENDFKYLEECRKKKIEPEYRQIINGEIQNFIFESLDIKTTKITSEIDERGTSIITKLIDREIEIYSITEKSNFKELKNISIQLYFLNRVAKRTFTQRMGIEPVNYGNVFIYKNGFRVHPYGDPRNDLLGIDTRALQSYSRFLGTRNLMGQIDIIGENNGLKETTSRDGGLIRTQAFIELIRFFFDKALKRLEKYVVDVTEWGVDTEDLKELSSKDIKKNLVNLIANITKDDSIINISYNNDIIKLIDDAEKDSAKTLIKNFKRIASDVKDNKLLKDAIKLEKKFETFKGLNKENAVLLNQNAKIVKELETKSEQLSIVTSIESQDLANVTNLHHQVFVISDTIKSILKEFSLKLTNNEKITHVELKELIDEISLENSKIESISKFGMRAIFEDFNSVKKKDLVGFLENYVEKISNYFKTSKLKVTYKPTKDAFNIAFRPLDISIIVDNMINNAKKHKATNMLIEANVFNGKQLMISFKDNGTGLDSKIKDSKKIFEKGFSTTGSTGLGLYHVNNIVNEYNWQIDVNTAFNSGAEFIIKINK